MNIEIDIASPEYRGAPYPAFDPKCINEKSFEDELRFKEAHAMLDLDGMTGEVEWLAQASDHFSEKLENEIVRAFKANGAKTGTIIHVKFGLRDDGYNKDYDIEVK